MTVVGRAVTHALERAENARRLEEERGALAAFAAFTEAVSEATDVPALVRLAFSVLPTRFPRAVVGYFEPAGEGAWKAVHVTGRGPEREVREHVTTLEQDVTGAVRAGLSRDALFVDDWAGEDDAGGRPFGKVAFYPLRSDGEVRAVLAFGVRDLRRWGDRDRALVGAIGRSLQLAFERIATTSVHARQNAELAARTRALEAFAALSRDLSTSSGTPALVRTAQEVVLSLLPPGYGVFYELDGDTWRLTVQTGDLRNDALQAAVDRGLPYASARTLVIPWESRQAFYQDEYDITTDNLQEFASHITTTAALPVLAGGTPVGVFVVGLFDTRRWSEVDRAILEGVVRSLGIAVEGARGAAELVERTREVQTWRERYEVAVRGSGHLLYDWDPVTDHIVYGGAVEEITGYAEDELQGNLADWTDHLIHPDDRPHFAAEIARVIETHDEFHLPFRVVRRDGSVRLVEDDGFFRRDAARNVTRMVGLVKDVTERERTLEALRRSNSELEQFANVASHDLQAPIRAVTSFADAVSRRYGDALDERGQAYLRQIVENGEHMKRLVDDLLTYARVSREQHPMVPTDANEVFDMVVRRLGPDVEALGASVTRGGLPVVLADAQQLDQLLQNLVSNALKYHREDAAPEVRVTARREGTFWRFAVADNGLGIEPQYFDRIFGMFQRLHGRGQYEGTGIGLAVCRRIVQRHGGRLWVESEPGRGSTFLFTLPSA